MSLWCAQFFHHHFQFHEIQETIATNVKSAIENKDNTRLEFDFIVNSNEISSSLKFDDANECETNSKWFIFGFIICQRQKNNPLMICKWANSNFISCKFNANWWSHSKEIFNAFDTHSRVGRIYEQRVTIRCHKQHKGFVKMKYARCLRRGRMKRVSV